MELHQLDPAVILAPHHGIRKSARGERFADARRALQNQIFVLAEQRRKNIELPLVHIYFADKLRLAVCFVRLCRSCFQLVQRHAEIRHEQQLFKQSAVFFIVRHTHTRCVRIRCPPL